MSGKFELKCLECDGSVVVEDGDSTIGQVGVSVVYDDDAEDTGLAQSIAEGDVAVRLWCKCGNGIVIE